jgi:hypothetical protein
MPNDNRNKVNQPPTGEGKKQSPMPGEPNKLNKRAEVLQASNAEQNIGSAQEEEAARTGVANEDNTERKMKAGR